SAVSQLAHELSSLPALVVLVIAGGRRSDVVTGEQDPRVPGVLAGDQIDLPQHTKRAQRQVFEVADRRGDDEEGAGRRRQATPTARSADARAWRSRAAPLRRLFLGFRDENRLLVTQDHLARDHTLLEPLDRGKLVHDLEHHLFQDGAESAGARAPLESLASDRGDGIVGELEPHLLEIEVLLLLLDDLVLLLLQDQ